MIRRPANLAVGKVRTRPDDSATRSTAQSTEDATSTSSATLVSPSLLSLPKDSTANDNDTYPTNNNTNNNPTVGPSTRRPSTLRQRSTIPSPDLKDSASLASIASSSTAVSDSQLPNQNPNKDQDHNTQVWGLVYLLIPTQYSRFQEQHLQPSTSRGNLNVVQINPPTQSTATPFSPYLWYPNDLYPPQTIPNTHTDSPPSPSPLLPTRPPTAISCALTRFSSNGW